MRKGKEQVIQVKVGSLPGSPDEVQAQTTLSNNTSKDLLGLSLVEFTRTGPNGPSAGVQVKTVKPDSPAAKAGLKAEDVITQLAFNEINNLNDYQKVVGGLKKNESYAVRFYREGRAVFRSIIIEN